MLQSFDADIFWKVLKLEKVTGYYASPSIHSAIVQYFQNEPSTAAIESNQNNGDRTVTVSFSAKDVLSVNASHMRFVASASAPLSPTLAHKLAHTFPNALILPCYGMTECMPISCPPLNDRLKQPQTSTIISTTVIPTNTASGKSIGPEIIIVDEKMSSLPRTSIGHILIRGMPLFSGYENDDNNNNNCDNNKTTGYNESTFRVVDGKGGWFFTGDIGKFDKYGYLHVLGRSKEVINRGGETLSPSEIEEVIESHPSVRKAMAFAVPHNDLIEVVGAVLVHEDSLPRIDLSRLHDFLSGVNLYLFILYMYVCIHLYIYMYIYYTYTYIYGEYSFRFFI